MRISSFIKRCSSVIFAVGAASAFCFAADGAVRLPEEKKAAEELLKVLDPDSAAEASGFSEEIAARMELAEVLGEALSFTGGSAAETAAAAAEPAAVAAAAAETTSAAAETTEAETVAWADQKRASNPPEHGEFKYIELGEVDGRIRLHASDLKKCFPNMTRWSGSGGGGKAVPFEYLLRTSLTYASDVVTEGKSTNNGGSYTSFPTDEESYTIIMVQDTKQHICGFSCWHPEKIGEGKWRIKLADCDYDYSEMFEADCEAFKETSEWAWIEPDAETIAACGAEYYTVGYNDTANKLSEFNLKRQLYLVWIRGKENSMNRIKGLPDDADKYLSNERTKSRYYAFYDKDRKIIGYTNIIGSSLDTEALRELLKSRENDKTN